MVFRRGTCLSLLPLIAACQVSYPSDSADAGVGVVDATYSPIPEAAKRPVELSNHGHVRSDEYYWLRERESAEVIEYLEAENAYTKAVMAHTEGLRRELFEEIKGRIKQDDETVPYKRDDYYYYSRYEEGRQYPLYCRRRGSLAGDEVVTLDVNAVAEGHEFCSVRGLAVSSNQDLMAYSVDTIGRRIYTLRFKDLASGETLADEIPAVTGNVAWANDDKTLFYTKQDPTTLRWFQIYRHTLGSDASEDELVYEEKDETFSCFVFKTKSKRFVVIGSTQTLSAEYRFLDANAPGGEFQVALPREREHEYSLDHFGDHFYIRTNKGAKNFRLVRAPIGSPGEASWEDVIPGRDDVLFEDFEIFSEHLVAVERKDGLIQLQVRPWSGGDGHYIDFGEAAYTARPQNNYDFDSSVLRFRYSSMTTPNSVFDYDMQSRERELMKEDEVLGGFDKNDYVTERRYAKARDGAEVPVSIVYRNGVERDGSNPLLLYGYGSYGNSLDASFSSSRISLLDRGFVYAIAHVRGGEERGRWWYEDGKLLKKKNTFTDFIDVGEFLVAEDYTSSGRMFAMGGSAGGLLMGAVANMRPDLFHGIVARVPFVDVITTMLDDSIPLTTSEYDEWGNPNDKVYYDYMLSYSPYDQVGAQDYPHLLVTTGLHDSQVQYWEPAKWVARLRDRKTDTNRLLMKTNMEAGHGGASGRFKRYEDIAFIWAFLLDLARADA